MKAFPSVPGRATTLPQTPIVIIGVLFGAALLFALVLLVGAAILTVNIQSNLERSTQLLPKLSDLRAELYSLHADTEATLNSELPNYTLLAARRQSVVDRLAEVRKVAPATEEYIGQLQTVDDTLQVFDLVITAFQDQNPAPGRETALLFQARTSFTESENALAGLYNNESSAYSLATNNASVLLSNLLYTLIGVGVFVTILGGVLGFTIRQSSQREAVLASGRLQVAAEVGAAAATVLSLDQLFETTLNLIVRRFGYIYAALFLLDEHGEYAVLRAATGDVGKNLIASKHKVLVGSNSTIGFVTYNNRPRVYSETKRQTEYFKSELISSTRSELAVPLRQAGRVIGALDVQAVEESPFSDADTTIMQTLADQIAVAIGNAAEFTREQERARQLSALSQASAELTGPQISLSTLLENVTQQSRRLLNADDSGLWLPVDNDLELKVSASQPEQVGRRLLKSEGISGQAFTTRKSLRIDDYPRWSGRARGTASSDIQSAVAVPLMWQGEAVGTLTVTRTLTNRPFTGEDERIAQLFASQAAAAIENTRLLQETQNRVNELYTLNQIGQAIAAQTELKALFDVVRQEVTRAVRAKTFYVALYDATAQTIELPYSFAEGVASSIPPFPIGQGLTSLVVKNRQALLIHTQEEAKSLGAFVSGEPSQSYLGVPILQRDEVLGVLAVQDQEKQNAYTDTDTRLLLTVASQVGLAIQNIRLLQQTRQRVIELSFIAEISQALTSQLNPVELVNAVGEKIIRLFDVQHAYIALYDGKTNRLQFPFFVEAGELLTIPPAPLGEGLTSIIVHNRQPLLINRDAAQRALELGARVTGQPAKSFLGVPMIAGDNVIGVMSIQNPEREGLFGGGEMRLLTTIAANAATSLENTRLFAETQRNVQDLSVINTVSEQIIRQTDLNSLSRVVVRQLMNLFDVATAYITILDRGTNLINSPTMFYQGQPHDMPPFPLGEGLSSLVLETGQPLLINRDLPLRPTELRAAPVIDEEAGRSFLGVPIITDEGATGVLAVQDHRREGRFGDDDVRLLTTLAGQVGLAIQNLNLLHQTRRRAEQLTTAAEVGRAAISILNPDDLIVRATELIRERFDLYYAAVFLTGESGQWANLKYATGQAGQTLMERKHRLEIGGQSMVGTAVSMRRARIALDVGREAVRFANPLLPDTHSEMALPLVVGDNVLGALDVQSTQYNAFSEDDITVLQTMADQIAVAIQNAQLYLQTEQRVRLEQQINLVTGKMRRTLDTESIMATALSELQQLLGARRIVAKLGPESMLRAQAKPQADHLAQGNGRQLGGNGHAPDNGRRKGDAS